MGVGGTDFSFEMSPGLGQSFGHITQHCTGSLGYHKPVYFAVSQLKGCFGKRLTTMTGCKTIGSKVKHMVLAITTSSKANLTLLLYHIIIFLIIMHHSFAD